MNLITKPKLQIETVDTPHEKPKQTRNKRKYILSILDST